VETRSHCDGDLEGTRESETHRVRKRVCRREKAERTEASTCIQPLVFSARDVCVFACARACACVRLFVCVFVCVPAKLNEERLYLQLHSQDNPAQRVGEGKESRQKMSLYCDL